MKKISQSILSLCLVPSLGFAQAPSYPLEGDSIEQQVEFLTSTDGILFEGDGFFQTVTGATPYSYYTRSMVYFGDYLCGAQAGLCNVVDIILDDPFAVIGDDSNPSGTGMQIERVLMSSGSDVYDVATWQVALALAAYNGYYNLDSAANLVANASDKLNKLTVRADTQQFTYGNGSTKTQIKNPQYTYVNRMVGKSFLSEDPFYGTPYYYQYVTPAEGFDGQITWTDWKPISGENAWAQLIGPLQALYLLNNKNVATIDFHHPALQNAIHFLPALQRMQAGNGGIYYAMLGATGNTGEEIPSGQISTENNASVLGGLNVLSDLLTQISAQNTNLSADDKAQLASAQNVIAILLYGGDRPQGGETTGLVSYFKDSAFDPVNQTFITDGQYNNGQFTPDHDMFAVDVNTWGISALGPQTIDTWFGEGTAFNMLQYTFEKGGYTVDGELWGVGYSDENADGQNVVLSGEWTLGAMSAARILVEYYEQHPSSQVDTALLQTQLTSMSDNITRLRTDSYTEESFAKGIGEAYQQQLVQGQQAYLYASERYEIPFGWFANPIPSAASTSWAILTSYNFNPFVLGGQVLADLTEPVTAYDKTGVNLYQQPNTYTILNAVQDEEGQFYNATIAVSYALDAKNPEWLAIQNSDGTDLHIENGHFASVSFPSGTEMVSISYQPIPSPNAPGSNGWYQACTVDVRENASVLEGDPVMTAIKAAWQADAGPCDIIYN